MDVFREFASSLTTDISVALTPSNAASYGLLAKEFCFPDLATACAKLSQDPLWALERRVSTLEVHALRLSDVERLDLHEQRIEQLFAAVSD
jgi:hypothetical protein